MIGDGDSASQNADLAIKTWPSFERKRNYIGKGMAVTRSGKGLLVALTALGRDTHEHAEEAEHSYGFGIFKLVGRIDVLEVSFR